MKITHLKTVRVLMLQAEKISEAVEQLKQWLLQVRHLKNSRLKMVSGGQGVLFLLLIILQMRLTSLIMTSEK